MSPVDAKCVGIVERFPRVSGDEPNLLLGLQSDPLFSPRERG